MLIESRMIRGVVRGGVIVPEAPLTLPEGTPVEIAPQEAIPPELQNEIEAWERAGQDAWAMIDRWEDEAIRPSTSNVFVFRCCGTLI